MQADRKQANPINLLDSGEADLPIRCASNSRLTPQRKPSLSPSFWWCRPGLHTLSFQPMPPPAAWPVGIRTILAC